MEGMVGDAAASLPASYEEFVAARTGALFRVALLMTRSRADSEDLLQTTLVKVYVEWDRVRDAASPDAYVRRILLNTFLSSRRLARFSREVLVHAVPDDPVHDHDHDERLSVWPHVKSLPPRQRAVIVLRYYEGLSEREIAAALGCGTGTVKSTASAAMKNLRSRMGETR